MRSFIRTAAAAQDHGFRACKRCRPDAAPGSPEWDVRGDVAGRAMRLITEGVVDREGVEGLAECVNFYSNTLGLPFLIPYEAGGEYAAFDLGHISLWLRPRPAHLAAERGRDGHAVVGERGLLPGLSAVVRRQQ